MPKEKVLYVCDENHNEQDVPLELRETVPYPENMHYGVKDSIHYYYICPACSKTYLAYHKIDEPIEWTSLEKEVWDKRITNVRDSRVSVLKKGLVEQKTEIERVHSETERNLKETTMKKEGLIKELQKKTALLDQLKKDEEDLQKKSTKENNDLSLINKKIENLTSPQPSLLA